MANNRLYIYDKETGEKLCIAKSMGRGWYPSNHFHLFEEWIANRDKGASKGNCYDASTELELITENDKRFNTLIENE